MDKWLAEVIQFMIVGGTIVSSLGLILFARRKGPRVSQDALAGIEARLLRIEQAVDSIAVEVERVSEGQRFTARVLAEKGAVMPASPLRQITPH